MQHSRNDRCLSDFRLDLLLAAELDAGEASSAHGHVSGCDTCAARLAALEAERDRFRTSAPALELLPRQGRRRAPAVEPGRPRLWRWMLSGGLVAAAAMVMLLLVRGRAGPDADEPIATTQVKGTQRIAFWVKRGDQVEPGMKGEVLHPGDEVQFTASATQPGFVVIASVDRLGQISIYHPDGDRATAFPAGRDEPLPGSIVLDDVLGVETIHAFFCATPVTVASVSAALVDGRAQVAGCSVDRIRWEKRPR